MNAPLSLKICVWLLLNLLVLTAAVGVFCVSQLGFGLGLLRTGNLGERIQRIGDSVASDYFSARGPLRSEVLAKWHNATGADFYLFENNGRQEGGMPVVLPAAFRGELERGRPARGPEGPGFPPPEPGDFGPGGPGPLAPPGAQSRRNETSRFVHRDKAYWIGVRVPFGAGDRPMRPGTVVIRAEGPLVLIRLLEAGPWIAFIVGAVVFSVLLWVPLVLGITRSVKRLTAATERIAQGRFDTRVSVSRRDELGRLGESVNRMAERLDGVVNGQKRFLGDVAHELASPAGRLQLAVDILETKSGGAFQEPIADVRDEARQIASLVNELLAFTQAGMSPAGAALGPVEAAPLVAAVIAREGVGSDVAIVSVEAGTTVQADERLLARAIGNLVRNAVRYGGPKGPVFVTAWRDAQTVVMRVEDEGPGVPEAALCRLGEPFFRPEIARTRESGGVGLGLAIVRSASAACGGTVSFSNRAPRGFRAEIRLKAS